ncbi:MAG: DUF3892 domain-containing protein [Myxococcales bacterium]|nr:MAG: DUF3892 domain-containing protein [Myxococcales bacterium]
MDRRVTKTGKDSKGNITSLCSPGASWSPRSKTDAIKDIESGASTYYVEEVAPKVSVKVVSEAGSKYLRTTTDKTNKNNLDNLPDC